MSRVLFCNDIVESVIIKFFLAKRWVFPYNKVLFGKEVGVSIVILDPDLLKLSIMQVDHFWLFDLHYQMSP